MEFFNQKLHQVMSLNAIQRCAMCSVVAVSAVIFVTLLQAIGWLAGQRVLDLIKRQMIQGR